MWYAGIIIVPFGLFILIVSGRAIFYAFVKKKDERSKWIVTKSMADSFICVVILQSILTIIKLIDYGFYQKWWSSLTQHIYVEPSFLSFIILGIILLINTKKHGGSL